MSRPDNGRSRLQLRRHGDTEPQKKWVIVAFGDTTGFSSWSRRVEDDSTHFLRYMLPLARLFTSLRDNETTVKKFGDGCMIVAETDDKYFVPTAMRIIKKAITLYHGAKKIRKDMRHPKPFEFRIRMLAGPAWMWADHGEEIDYYGKTINSARHLLAVAREESVLCHENVIERIPASVLAAARIKSRRLPPQECPAGNVDKEDLALLYRLMANNSFTLKLQRGRHDFRQRNYRKA